MKVITNNVPRPLLPLTDLPEKARKDFDYLGPDEAHDYRLVQYKGEWYDVWDSTRCTGAEAPAATRHAFAGWDGYISDLFFSGVLFRFADDGCVVVGRYFC